jgi:hypothetical protein
MRWEALFADLEAQAAALDAAERAGEVEERARAEIGGLGLVDRARAALGRSLRLRVAGGTQLTGRLVRAGPDWLLLDESGGREALVASDRLVTVHGLGRYSAVPGSAGVVESRIGLRQVLRGVARDRSDVVIHLIDGTTAAGTIDRVGADFVELAGHAVAEPRRRREVRDVDLLPLGAIAAVRRSV